MVKTAGSDQKVAVLKEEEGERRRERKIERGR